MFLSFFSENNETFVVVTQVFLQFKSVLKAIVVHNL